MKVCIKCNLDLPLDQFYDGQAKCKECCKAASRARHALIKDEFNEFRRTDPNYKAKRRERNNAAYAADPQRFLLRQKCNRVGITIEQYEAMLVAQKNECAICREPFEDTFKTHLDHDHETGEVRGVLCYGCNLGLGHMKDDSKRLRAAADYIEFGGWFK